MSECQDDVCGCHNISFVDMAMMKISELQEETRVLREQLEESFAALRHANDYIAMVKQDAKKIEEDNHHLIDELYNHERMVQDLQACVADGMGRDPTRAVLAVKPINEMTVDELVSLANDARRVLDEVNTRIVAWCNTPYSPQP
jgi:chromosome segregation ATPase